MKKKVNQDFIISNTLYANYNFIGSVKNKRLLFFTVQLEGFNYGVAT